MYAIKRERQKTINPDKRTMVPASFVSTKAQNGVGIVEILVAVVILAIGFLAAARMQVTGMRYSQSAYFSSQAYFMAGDMIARMRANPNGVNANAYDNATTAASLPNPGCSAKMCTPAEIAAQDLFDWSRHLHGAADDSNFSPLLPSNENVTAAGTVTRLASGAFSVNIVWADDPDAGDGTGSLRVDMFTEN